jgi:hypothetical protein
MDQFESREIKASPRQSLSRLSGPVTPLPLPGSGLPETEKRKLLRVAVSGDEPFCSDETPTALLLVIPSLARDPTTKTIRGGSGYTVYENSTLVGMQLLTCAVMQHIQDSGVIPMHLYVSATLFSKVIEDMRILYRATYNGTVPFLVGQEATQDIPISIRDDMPEDTVVCKD